MPLNLPYLPFKYVDDKKLYKNIKYPKIPFQEQDIYVTTTFGDRLDLLADRFYRDTKLWWVINFANPTKVNRDSLFLKPGTQIRIPTDIPSILQKFEELNS